MEMSDYWGAECSRREEAYLDEKLNGIHVCDVCGEYDTDGVRVDGMYFCRDCAREATKEIIADAVTWVDYIAYIEECYPTEGIDLSNFEGLLTENEAKCLFVKALKERWTVAPPTGKELADRIDDEDLEHFAKWFGLIDKWEKL